MSERGVFAVDRGVFDHDCFADEPFTEREAWIWLVSEAAWKPRARRIGNINVSLDRGQLAASVRFMADKWKWSKSAVDRFLARLKNRDMIETENGTGLNVITICKYDDYQRVSLPDGTDGGTQTGTAAGQQRDKTEDIKYIEKKDIGRSDWPTDFRERFWAAYPRRVGKQGAIRELERVRARGDVPFAKLQAAIIAYAATADPKFTKHPKTWLSNGCWDDEPLKSKTETMTAATITPASPSWNAWKAYYRDTNQNFKAALMDKSAADGKPFTVPSEWPPGKQEAA
jgi:hypothetical protein